VSGSHRAMARLLKGRTIVGYKSGAFRDGRGGWAHDPRLILDNGAVIAFNTEETEVGDYGTAIIYCPACPPVDPTGKR